jgi:hypothetical protein
MFVFLEKFEGTPLDIKPFLDSPLLLFWLVCLIGNLEVPSALKVAAWPTFFWFKFFARVEDWRPKEATVPVDVWLPFSKLRPELKKLNDCSCYMCLLIFAW